MSCILMSLSHCFILELQVIPFHFPPIGSTQQNALGLSSHPPSSRRSSNRMQTYKRKTDSYLRSSASLESTCYTPSWQDQLVNPWGLATGSGDLLRDVDALPLKSTSATSQQAESHPIKLDQTAKQWVRQLPPNQPWSTCILCAFHSSSRWNAWESPESVLHPAVNNISKFSGHVKQNPEFHGGKQIVYCQVHCGCAETSTNV